MESGLQLPFFVLNLINYQLLKFARPKEHFIASFRWNIRSRWSSVGKSNAELVIYSVGKLHATRGGIQCYSVGNSSSDSGVVGLFIMIKFARVWSSYSTHFAESLRARVPRQ